MSIDRFAIRGTLCALGLIVPIVAQTQPTARPDLKVGDTWTLAVTVNSGLGGTTRREETRVVKEAGENGYRMENSHKGGGGATTTQETFSISRDLNFVSPTGASGALQEFKWLQWPLEPGRSYQFEVNAGSNIATWKGKVMGWEDVEVPAGKFKALHAEFERSGTFRYGASESLWYAPEAKGVVKRIQTRPGAERSTDVTTFELVSYKLN